MYTFQLVVAFLKFSWGGTPLPWPYLCKRYYFERNAKDMAIATGWGTGMPCPAGFCLTALHCFIAFHEVPQCLASLFAFTAPQLLNETKWLWVVLKCFNLGPWVIPASFLLHGPEWILRITTTGWGTGQPCWFLVVLRVTFSLICFYCAPVAKWVKKSQQGLFYMSFFTAPNDETSL